MLLNNIQIPQTWASAAAHCINRHGPIVILGAVDTGKSTFARYLLGRFIEHSGTAALLDGDIGQAIVGTPALVGLTLVQDVDKLSDRRSTDRSWFVGSTTPVGRTVAMVVAHAQLGRLAQQAGVPLVINTCGFVKGSAGKELHLSILDVITPKLVIGLQRDAEIEHLLWPLERRGYEVVRLKPAQRARPKPAIFREQLRTERFAAYFSGAEQRTLRLADYSLEATALGSNRPLAESARKQLESGLDTYLVEGHQVGDGCALVLASPPDDERAGAIAAAVSPGGIHVIEANETNGLLVGLLAADGESLGLALVESWDGDGGLVVFTPIDEASLRSVKRLALGSLRLTRTGDEIAHWRGERRIDGGPEVAP